MEESESTDSLSEDISVPMTAPMHAMRIRLEQQGPNDAIFCRLASLTCAVYAVRAGAGGTVGTSFRSESSTSSSDLTERWADSEDPAEAEAAPSESSRKECMRRASSCGGRPYQRRRSGKVVRTRHAGRRESAVLLRRAARRADERPSCARQTILV